MKKAICSFALILALLACQKDEIRADPAAIQALIDSTAQNCTCDPYIRQYAWKGKTIYLQGFAGPNCNWVPGYYDEAGKPFTMPANYTFMQFTSEADSERLIWSCKTGRINP